MLLYCNDVSSMTNEQFDLLFSMMPQERKEKAMRYVKTEDRLLSVAAFALLRYALNLYGYKIEKCELAKTEKGKPYFINLPLHFNLSHTSNAVACAVSQTEIGVDIQKKSVEYSRVMHRVCCKNEIELISASKNPAEDFAKLWTLKESYIKCIGAGISDNISAYDFSSIIQNGSGRLYNYNFNLLDVGESVLSVCSSSHIKDVKKLSLTEIEAYFKNAN